MAKQSAGILLYRLTSGTPEVLLVHPGGPFWAKKDAGAWSIPKGEYADGEDPLSCALREFREETGAELSREHVTALGDVKQRSGKVVTAWAAEGDFDIAGLRSNTFSMVWPPKSGKHQEFPEVDRAEWFAYEAAAEKILPAQLPLIERLLKLLESSTPERTASVPLSLF